jgi:two-component system sensor histidine kinase KdpD
MCLAGVAVCTWISFRLEQNLASVGFLYLVFVVLAAVYGGFWHATIISIVSVACLDYFFNPPIFSLSVDRLSNWVELGAFEFTALIISRLSNRAQMRAFEAMRERAEASRLYETARRILLIDVDAGAGREIASLVRTTFDLDRVVLFDALAAATFETGAAISKTAREELNRRTRDCYLADSNSWECAAKRWFCVLRLGTRPVGAIALCGTTMNDLNAQALASLCAITLERARALEMQSHAEAERQAEKLRTAVLDALAHKFKTPLTVIRTAVSGLPAAGEVSGLQSELLGLIDQEAQKLNDLAYRLLGAPDLDAGEFAPQPEPLLLSRVVGAVVDELDAPEERQRFRFIPPELESPVFADRELIFTALAQLVENALKYSTPSSPIDIAMRMKDSSVLLALRTHGLVVAPEDRERIFDRFYRTPDARDHTSGTGLGLSIVKSIARDHRGQVWADGEPGYGTTFSLSLPMPEKALA